MEAVFLKLLNMSITACWLVLAVVILRLVLKKAPRALICGLWALVAVRLLIPFSIESMFSLIPDPEPVTDRTVYETVVYQGAIIVPEQSQENAPASWKSTAAEESKRLLSAGSIAWLAGMGVMVLYAAVSYLLLLRRTAEGVEQEKGVWLCDRIESPFILGIFRPRIFLPTSIEPGDVQFVLSHELAHLKRLDHFWKPLGFLLLTVYWFNPVLWLAYVLLCRDIELACDEKVLQQLGKERKQEYSTALINCSVPRRMICACPLAFGENGIKGRVKAILNYKKPAFWIIVITLIISAAVAVCFLTNPRKEQERETKTVTLELISQQADSLTVEWANNTDQPVVVGYDSIYVNEDGRWVESMIPFQADDAAVIVFRGWNYTLEAGERYQQIVYYHYIDINEPGEYRLDMKYEDDSLKESIISLEFEVKQVDEYTLSYTGPVWTTKLTCEKSPDPLKPTILLSDDGQFQFQYAGLSSYVACGTYQQTDDALILTTDDGSGNYYSFIEDGWMTYRFDAGNSTKLPKYKYDGVEQTPIPDGAVFEPYLNDGRIITAASIPAYVDSDDTPEYWTVVYQPAYGLFVFEITASDQQGRIMYNDVFQYEFLSMSIIKKPDGDLQLCVVKADDLPTVCFDISVVNGHITLTSEQETIVNLDTSEII